jgi:hypothetical protein
MFTTAKITQVWLDSKRFEATYYFNKSGQLYDVLDRYYGHRGSDKNAENMFVNLGIPFKTGDIVSAADYGHRPISYGVVVQPSGKVYGNEDFGDEVQFVFDIWDGTLGHSHIPTWKLELFSGELPEADKPLLELQRHLRLEKQLSPKRMSTLDPDNVWRLETYWELKDSV